MHNAGTNWNQNHGCAETLLENWVEERALGSEKVLQERKDGKSIQKYGHVGILSHTTNPIPKTTTNQDYNKKEKPKRKVGKKTLLIEKHLMERAVLDTTVEPADNSAKHWMSTNHCDFDHSDVYLDMEINLGSCPPSESEIAMYKTPITFWTDGAAKKLGHSTCGKNTSFSTPITEKLRE